MSASVKYKGVEIAAAANSVALAIQTGGKFCEDDIEVLGILGKADCFTAQDAQELAPEILDAIPLWIGGFY